ncbi:MAG: hypothetical protein LBQ64_02115 [Bacteroidales bacterium]|jgi:hypothetical protein|nr:hypothetical protein [Bacteroidales bacterium]
MNADTKKTEVTDLIARIKTQQEIIGKQTVDSLIDIDLQLDYIRSLYELYTMQRTKICMQKEKTEKKPYLSECGTLSLFDNIEDVSQTTTPDKEEINFAQTDTILTNSESISTLSSIDTVKQKEENPVESQEEIKTDIELPTQRIETIEETIEQKEESPLEKQEDTETDIELPQQTVETIEESIEEPKEETDLFASVQETKVEMQITKDEPIIEIPFFDHVVTEIKTEEKPPVAQETEYRYSMSKPDFIVVDPVETVEPKQEIIEEKEEKEEEKASHLQTTNVETVEQQNAHQDRLDQEKEEILPDKPTSIGDKFKDNKPSLNEIVSGFKPDSSIGMKLQHGSISDLMKSIDMNLKFLLVKELFKGNGSVFTEEINKLNNFNKLYEAIDYLETIKNTYKWDKDNEAYNELYKLILRKFAK